MIETLRIDEFEGNTVLVHKREDGFNQAIVMNGVHAGVIVECMFPVVKDWNKYELRGE